MERMNQNPFDEWNEVKKRLAVAPRGHIVPKERQVWVTRFGLNVGFEQNGSGDLFSRPVLVIKKFNTQMFWVVPLTNHQKALDFYYNFTDPQGKAVAAIPAQLRLLSAKRFDRLLYHMEPSKHEEIVNSIRRMLP